MCHNIVNKRAKFHGDRTIGGAITVKKLACIGCKWTFPSIISVVKSFLNKS